MPKNYIESVCDEMDEKFSNGELCWNGSTNQPISSERTIAFLKSSLESLLRKAMEAVGEEETRTNLDDDTWNYKVLGSNERRRKTLASLQAL